MMMKKKVSASVQAMLPNTSKSLNHDIIISSTFMPVATLIVDNPSGLLLNGNFCASRCSKHVVSLFYP